MYIELSQNNKIKKILNEIIKENPDSRLAYNYRNINSWVDLDDIVDEYIHNYNDNYGLNICGCGSPELVIEVIWKILTEQKRYIGEIRNPIGYYDNHSNHQIHRENLYNIIGYTNKDEGPKENQLYQALIEFVLKVLNSKGFLEHGSSVGGSWLTQKGEDLLYVLELYMEDLKDGGE